MNILPKKSWHVRNKDNVAKVRKDEENARNEERERHRRIALAEQEARTDLLRRKARGDKPSDDQLAVVASSRQSVNFFEGIEAGTSVKNAEHEEEKRLEKEQQEKKIGLLTYLGQSAVETMKDEEKPWYFQSPSRMSTDTKDGKRKAYLDPLNDVREHLSRKKKSKTSHKKRKVHSRDNSVASSSNSDKTAQLRKARLEREARERQRTRTLLEKHYGVEKSREVSPPTSSRFAQKYNNQFNPLLARNNKVRK